MTRPPVPRANDDDDTVVGIDLTPVPRADLDETEIDNNLARPGEQLETDEVEGRVEGATLDRDHLNEDPSKESFGPPVLSR